MKEELYDFIESVRAKSDSITRKQMKHYLRSKYDNREASIESLVNSTLRLLCETKSLKRIDKGVYEFTDKAKNRK